MKSVLITGCSSGFGHQMVRLFLDDGWHVYASMRQAKERGSLFAEELAKFPSKLSVISLDVTKEEDRMAALHAIPQLDCLVNNAGYGLFGALEDLSETQIREQMEVNFFGLVLLTQALLPKLRASKGRIINITSVFGFSGFPLTAAYCASKFAVEGFSESLRHELAPLGVQVAVVAPGGHRTKFGDKVIWGEKSFDGKSAYSAATKGYLNFKDKMSNSPNPATADSVAREVLKLSKMPNMPGHITTGKDAAAMSFLRIPKIRGAIAEKLVRKIYRSKFLGGA